MPQTFFGSWSMQVVSKDADFAQRIVISGSRTSDGIKPGEPGTSVDAIEGEEWTVELEWSGDQGKSWSASAIRRTPRVSGEEGFIIALGADDNAPEFRDGDFNDMVVVFRSLDPEVNPPGTGAKGPDFSLPKEWLKD